MNFINDSNTSYIRVLHAAPKAPAVDIYVNSIPIFKNVNFKEFTPYVPVPKGQYRITVYPAGKKDQAVITQDATISPGKVMTIAATGNLDDLTLVPYIEINTNGLDEQTARLRVVHLSPNAPAVDVFVDGVEMFDGVSFRHTTEYFYFPKGNHKIEIKAANTNDKVLSFDVNLNGNKVYTLYVVGDLPDLQILQSSDGSSRLA